MFLFFYSSLAIIIDEKLKLYDSEKRGTKREIQRRKEPYSKPNFIISNNYY